MRCMKCGVALNCACGIQVLGAHGHLDLAAQARTQDCAQLRAPGCPPPPMINIPLGLSLRITRKPAKPFAATALSGKGESFPLIRLY